MKFLQDLGRQICGIALWHFEGYLLECNWMDSKIYVIDCENGWSCRKIDYVLKSAVIESQRVG